METSGLIIFFILFVIVLILILIDHYQNRFTGWKNIYTLEQAIRHHDKLPKLDDPEAKKEFRKMLDEISEKKGGRKITDEEFEGFFKFMQKQAEEIFKPKAK